MRIDDIATLRPRFDANTVTDRDPLAEAELIAAVALGDRAAFDRLYSRTSAKLFGVCVRILNDGAAAEEALQDTFISVWRLAARFDAGRGSPMTWLVTIARSRAIDRFRAGRRMAALPIEAADAIADPAEAADDRLASAGETRRLMACLETLDTDDAGLIRTAFFEGSTYAELAERAGRPLGTVKSRIRRALLSLRACLA